MNEDTYNEKFTNFKVLESFSSVTKYKLHFVLTNHLFVGGMVLILRNFRTLSNKKQPDRLMKFLIIRLNRKQNLSFKPP